MGYVPSPSGQDLQYIFNVLQQGAQKAIETVTELSADNGAKIADVVKTTATAGNGEAVEVVEAVAVGEGATAGTATGVAILGTEVSAGVAGIAIALGVVGGVALYNLAPEFFDNIAEELTEAGQTIGGKIVTFMDNTGKTSFSDDTINIVKNALVNEGIFQPVENPATGYPVGTYFKISDYSVNILPIETAISYVQSIDEHIWRDSPYYSYLADKYATIRQLVQQYGYDCFACQMFWQGNTYGVLFHSTNNFKVSTYVNRQGVAKGIKFDTEGETHLMTGGLFPTFTYKQWGTTTGENSFSDAQYQQLMYIWENYHSSFYNLVDPNNAEKIEGWVLPLGSIKAENVQPNATPPNGTDPVGTTYPSWTQNPDPVPSIPDSLPINRPVSIPIETGIQSDAQTGINIGAQLDALTDIAYNVQPDPVPEPQPDPDPDPVPEPDPLPEILPSPQPDPINPNPDPPISGVTPTIPTISTTSANALFTVYNPTDAQLNSLGAFLWTNNIIEIIKKIWDNPIDGVIALHKIYATPTTSGTGNIILGYVDSEVSSAIVSGQFVTVDCGTVTVPESKHNATDYSPFTQIQIYLPFIGIQELDTNEIMGGSVHVVYKVDVYTGTCLALIYVQRAEDMSNAQLLYTFSGNCSQKLPLTASDFGGAVSALLGIVGVGVASGGALGGAVAGGVAHSLTSDMVHIQHSGGLSANSGILAPRKPFLIISRQYGYDASGYSSIYGYPANKTVYLSNCSGFVRVKAIQYKGKGTATENKMIVDALKGGVII